MITATLNTISNMLEEIHISNFAIIDQQTVPFVHGFNVMSGETGAGKSILIDALGLQLGDRADTGWIRHGTSRCEIQSSYCFPTDSDIQQWLTRNEFDDEDGTCQLRRTLSDNGKSKCYINGIPTTVGNTKQLGEMLVDIHGQHAHQSLMMPDKQLELLDHFAHHQKLLADVKTAYQTWQQLLKQQKQLQDGDSNVADKRDLLHYQLEELESLDIQPDEFTALSEEQKRLSAANDILMQISAIEHAIEGTDGDAGNLNSALNHLIHNAEQIAQLDKTADSITELFNQALIYIDEGHSALSKYAQSVELDPERLSSVESRMSTLHDIARKHRIAPDELLDIQRDLQTQLDTLDKTLTELNQLDENIEAAEAEYLKKAHQLSNRRKQSAKKLSLAVDERLAMLNLDNAHFSINFAENTTQKANGIDHIMFLFAPNPGQGEKPLHKIASGGELSRISLAIQVAGVANQPNHVNTTLIFDEVDSGIGGGTAEVVGRLLKTLSQYNQVICVTHLAQVAAFADQHIEINKSVKNNATFTQFHALNEAERIKELARMSGGLTPDKRTLEHAQELRDNALTFSDKLKEKCCDTLPNKEI